MKLKHAVLFLIALGAVAIPTAVFAQSISLTGPTSDQTLPTGDDFATDVLNQPWDGTNRRMIGWEENFVGNSVAAVNGVWQGTNEGVGGYVFPLFPGFRGTVQADPIGGDKTLPKLGARWQINASKYTRLAYKLNATSRSTLAIYWEGNPTKTLYWPDPGSPRGAKYDGYYQGPGITNAGFTIYDFDMTNLAGNFEQVQGSWSGNIYALRIDPSVAAPAGAVTSIDWVRLVDPNSAPNLTVSWNSSGLNSSYVISVFEDNDASGYNGSPLRRFINGGDPESYTFPSAILPPGDHYFYVEVQATSGGSYVGSPIRTGYSAKVTITNKPEVVITAPSQTSGEEYAVKVLGNAWDMDASGADVANLPSSGLPQILRQFVNASFPTSADAKDAGRIMQAQAEAPYPGNFESDAQVHLKVSQINSIDPSYYRYVSYRMAVDPTNYPTLADKIRRGWVTRVTAWNANIVADGFYSQAALTYEGWHDYTFDLADEGSFESGTRWNQFYRFPAMRLDVLETDVPTWFYLDYVKLNAENRTPTNNYTIKYTLSDTDSNSFNVGVYYDTNNSGFDGTLIAQVNGVGAGARTQNWSTATLPNNTAYWVYIVVSDGTNTRRAYSPVHIRTGKYVPVHPQARLGNTGLDYDGDGKSDQSVYRPGTGTFFFNKSTEGFLAIPWGNGFFKPFAGDFDGDGITDRGVVTNFNGTYLWYYVRSGDQGLIAHFWGVPGDYLAIGDYNGNGRDQIGVWRPSNGGWFALDEAGGASAQYWGLPGDVPAPADYDGDGKTDLAIWRPSDGNWWVINSGFTSGSTAQQFRLQQFGLPGDVPVVADWNSDTKADFAVWRPSTGTWFIRNNVSGAITAQQWGLPGDTVRVGDFNGDGLLDYTVWRAGVWYHNFRNGQTRAVTFGLPGDLLPSKVSLTRLF